MFVLGLCFHIENLNFDKWLYKKRKQINKKNFKVVYNFCSTIWLLNVGKQSLHIWMVYSTRNITSKRYLYSCEFTYLHSRIFFSNWTQSFWKKNAQKIRKTLSNERIFIKKSFSLFHLFLFVFISTVSDHLLLKSTSFFHNKLQIIINNLKYKNDLWTFNRLTL